MSTDIQTLTYADGIDLRAIRTDDGEVLLCLADLAHGLGIQNASATRFRLPEGVHRMYPIPDRLGRTQNATFVTEAGANMVIWRSDKPAAVAYGAVAFDVNEVETIADALGVPMETLMTGGAA